MMSVPGRLIAALLLVAVACGGKDTTSPTNNTGNTGATGPTGSTGPSGGSTSSSISILDNSFDPSATTVPAGTTITWTWNGVGTHNVTFSTAGFSGSGDKTNGGTFQKQFPNAGTYNFQCTNHPATMSGTITVSNLG